MAISLNIRLAASLLIAFASSFGSSPQAPPKHADVELLSRQASVKPNSDLQLSPAQHGNRVNYLIFPYVELGGEPYPKVANAISFSDVARSREATRAAR